LIPIFEDGKMLGVSGLEIEKGCVLSSVDDFKDAVTCYKMKTGC
jgi:hypothetical protein